MKAYPIKYLLFFLPYMAALFIELFILPIQTFTFRTWESLIVQSSFGILKGPFYPNMNVSMVEEGALAYRTPWAIKKDVTWITDKYGYRKANSPLRRHSVLIVGDSNIAGSSLSQNELLSEVLELRLGVSVYPLSPERLKAMHSHGLFRKHAPDILIMESVERGINNFKALSPLRPNEFQQPSLWSQFMLSIQLNDVLQKIAIVLDRLLKGNMLQYLRARINEKEPSINQPSTAPSCPTFFLQGPEVNQNASMRQIEAIAKMLKESSDVLSKKGMRFIFLPVPNKETIYFDCLKTNKPDFIERLVRRLRELNVEVIDTQAAFDEAYQKRSMLLYHLDDDHWNADGVKLTADLLEKQIRQGGPAPR